MCYISKFKYVIKQMRNNDISISLLDVCFSFMDIIHYGTLFPIVCMRSGEIVGHFCTLYFILFYSTQKA